MLANRDTFQQMMQNVDASKKGRARALLAERRVQIFSDMGETIYEGDVITLTGELVGFGDADVDLQWQFDDGMRWVDVPGATKITHSFVATMETIDYSWRLSVNVRDL